jgi:hypothetical protein
MDQDYIKQTLLMSILAFRLVSCMGIAALTGFVSNPPIDGYRSSMPMAPQEVSDAHVKPNARGVSAPRRISGSAPIYGE